MKNFLVAVAAVVGSTVFPLIIFLCVTFNSNVTVTRKNGDSIAPIEKTRIALLAGGLFGVSSVACSGLFVSMAQSAMKGERVQ